MLSKTISIKTTNTAITNANTNANITTSISSISSSSNTILEKNVNKNDFEQIKVLDTLKALRHKISNKKFHEYMNRNQIKNLLYANSTHHAPYYELYDKYLVYMNDTRLKKLKKVEGKLIHIPLFDSNYLDPQTSKYWYIHNSTRWCFPNYEIFLQLGFNILTSTELPTHIIYNIPLAGCFSKNIYHAKQQFYNFIYLPNYLNEMRSINQIKFEIFLLHNKGRVVTYMELYQQVEQVL
jgi:hypothetical protein